jgi:hypothetical protein
MEINQDSSAFMERSDKPDEQALRQMLGPSYSWLEDLRGRIAELKKDSTEEWNYSSRGWNARIKDKKRVIVYIMPRHNHFRASFVFGQKATEAALHSGISDATRQVIHEARVFAEGRGFRVEVDSVQAASDVFELAAIKIRH